MAQSNESVKYPCCPEGARYERETGACANDHPGDCAPEHHDDSTYGRMLQGRGPSGETGIKKL